MKKLTLGIPSKGRLMEQAQELLLKAGFKIERIGSDRGYRGWLIGLENIEIAFLSAADIASALKSSAVDLGITGEDLLRETIAPDKAIADVALRLNFGPADVVVAVPDFWIDVAQMSDLDDVARQFYAIHGRRLRVATKYFNLTRRFFAAKGVTGYRIVESLGATEGAPAAGSAELICRYHHQRFNASCQSFKDLGRWFDLIFLCSSGDSKICNQGSACAEFDQRISKTRDLRDLPGFFGVKEESLF